MKSQITLVLMFLLVLFTGRLWAENTQLDRTSLLDNQESLLVVRISLLPDTDLRTTRTIEDALRGLNPTKVRFLERRLTTLLGEANFVLLASPEAIDSIKVNIPVASLSGIDVFDPRKLKLLSNSHENSTRPVDVAASLANQSLPLEARVKSMASLHALSGQLEALPEQEKILVTNGVLAVLADLDQIHELVWNFTLIETSEGDFRNGLRGPNYIAGSKNNIRRAEVHLLKFLMLTPIRNAGKIGFSVLDKVQHTFARQAVVEASSAIYGAGLPLLYGQPHGLEHNYFREWLDQQRKYFELIERLPENSNFEDLLNLGLDLVVHSGKIFKKLPVRGQMTKLVDLQSPPLNFAENVMTEQVPTFLLGLPGDKEPLKRELIQYIIEADKWSQRLAEWVREAAKPNDHRRPQIQYRAKGDDRLYKFILELPRAPHVPSYTISNFSEAEYTKTIVEVLQQLLEIADVSLINDGAYVSILDAAVFIVEEVERKRDINPAEAERQRPLLEAVARLQKIVLRRMINGLEWMSIDNNHAKACAVFLSPNPGS